jgi:hypothetical protein
MSDMLNTTPFTADYDIAERNVPRLLAGIKALNRKATRLGVPLIQISEVGEQFQRVATGPATYRNVRFVTVRVSGAGPQVNGWTFAAVITSLEGTNMLAVVPGFDRTVPLAYRTSPPKCDHCGLARRRSETFVLCRSDRWVQVGRQCLKDFLGYNDPHRLADHAAMLAALRDLCDEAEQDDGEGGGGGGGGRSETWTPLERYLTVVAVLMRTLGWVSRTQAKEAYEAGTGRLEATADTAFTALYPAPGSDRDLAFARTIAAAQTEEDVALARAALDWAQAIPADTREDYLHNVRTIAVKGMTNAKFAGIAASIIRAYQRVLADERRAARGREVAATSRHFGTVGERAVFTLEVEKIITLDGQFGVTRLHQFVDGAGNVAVWFASGEALKEGSIVTVKATVKRHETRDGVAQTILSRVVEYVPPPPKAPRAPRAKKPAAA